MTIIETIIPGVYIIEPLVFDDARGWFMETYSKIKTPQIACDFVQDNHSYSAKKGTLRGIHFQYPPMDQSKQIRCIRGSVRHVVVDLRRGSDTYKQWIRVDVSSDTKKQIFVPRGCGNAFLTITDDVEIVYKADNYYSPEHDGAVLWSDPDLGIDWGIENPILSDKDSNAPLLKEINL